MATNRAHPLALDVTCPLCRKTGSTLPYFGNNLTVTGDCSICLEKNLPLEIFTCGHICVCPACLPRFVAVRYTPDDELPILDEIPGEFDVGDLEIDYTPVPSQLTVVPTADDLNDLPVDVRLPGLPDIPFADLYAMRETGNLPLVIQKLLKEWDTYRDLIIDNYANPENVPLASISADDQIFFVAMERYLARSIPVGGFETNDAATKAGMDNQATQLLYRWARRHNINSIGELFSYKREILNECLINYRSEGERFFAHLDYATSIIYEDMTNVFDTSEVSAACLAAEMPLRAVRLMFLWFVQHDICSYEDLIAHEEAIRTEALANYPEAGHRFFNLLHT
jgi:hypothetical protein